MTLSDKIYALAIKMNSADIKQKEVYGFPGDVAKTFTLKNINVCKVEDRYFFCFEDGSVSKNLTNRKFPITREAFEMVESRSKGEEFGEVMDYMDSVIKSIWIC